MSKTEREPVETLEVLVTADEAFPALERLFLSAEKEITAGFRIFDLRTKLRSAAAKKIGQTWFDLFQHTLDRGVSISMTLTDFDPIVGTRYHRKSWQTAQQLTSVQEVTSGGKLEFNIALHPAKAGLVPRAFLWRKVREKLRGRRKDGYTPALRGVSPDSLFDLSPVTHHQKLAVFDRKTLYIGGLDLDERRYDKTDHSQPSQETWQDVQVIVTGPVAKAAHDHLMCLNNSTRGKPPPPPEPGFVRTISAKRAFAPFHISPRTVVNEVEEQHLEAIRNAKGMLYFETQYFRHLPLAQALAAAGKKNPDLHLIMVLPAAPEDVAFEDSAEGDARMGEHLQAEAIKTVRTAFGARALFCSPAQPKQATGRDDRSALGNAPIIYVHSKVSIFDGDLAIVSSANLNGRSFRWDTEAGVSLTQSHHVKRLADRMSNHWMPDAPALLDDTPKAVTANWRSIVEANQRAEPTQRQSLLLPYDESIAAKFGQAVPVVPNELV